MQTENLGGGRPVKVIGGGFSGLTAAYYLHQAGYRVHLVERQTEPGGLIQTHHTAMGLVETAANAILASSELEEMCRDVDVELVALLKTARRRFIYRDGLRRWPLTARESLLLLRFAWRFALSREQMKPNPFESLRAWGSRTLSPAVSRYSLETALQGVYAGNPDELSASLLLQRFFTATRPPTGAQRGHLRGSVAPREGMGALPSALARYLQTAGVSMELSHVTSGVEVDPSRPTVIATSAADAAEILHTVDAETSANLRSVDYVPIITATVFRPRSNADPQGFGCLFAPEAERVVLGVIFNDSAFPERAENARSETWILGGAAVRDRQAFLEREDNEWLSVIETERRRFYPEVRPGGEPSVFPSAHFTRWPRAIPHYSIHLERILPQLKATGDRNYFLHGNYLGGLGLAKILERSRELPGVLEREARWS